LVGSYGEKEQLMEDIRVTFPGGKRVDAQVGAYVVRTDQPVEGGGTGSAVAPFDLFLASLATCAGIYVLGFCQARGLDTEGLALRQRVEVDAATKLPSRVLLELTLPPSFPEKYRTAVVRAAEGCKVKKTIAAAPLIDVVVTGGEAPLAEAS
jgi:ribosomal protein S12 methylthiotransferase accessory factor